MAAATRRQLDAALLLGLSTGLRTFTAPAVLALRERPLSGRRSLVLLAAAGELVADKLPSMPSRLQPRGLSGRLLSAAISGQRVAGPAGAAAGAGAAVASAVAGNAARGLSPGWPAAVCEDGVAIALASAGAARAAR